MHVLDYSDIIKLAKILNIYLFIYFRNLWSLIPCQSANFITHLSHFLQSFTIIVFIKRHKKTLLYFYF